ncbi:MAG: (Fe-S)-binding protein [Nanoarchaeota archaeon]|nr:(Fe-S)-binding protein [Nanoarchaeota archaeon]
MNSIEGENAKEEIEEILSKCIYCGLCNSNCGVFRILKEEKVSPRGQILILQDEIIDKIIYACNLCLACEEKCPVNVKVCDAIKKARFAMVESGKVSKGNKEILDNVRKFGNVHGKIS